MKKKSLKLQDLKVKSFITNSQSLTLKAGIENYNTVEVVGGTGCGCTRSLDTDIVVTCPATDNTSFIAATCNYLHNTCNPTQSVYGAICDKSRGISCNCATIQC